MEGLAEPQFMVNDLIELFGAEVCSFILQEGLRKGGLQARSEFASGLDSFGGLRRGVCDNQIQLFAVHGRQRSGSARSALLGTRKGSRRSSSSSHQANSGARKFSCKLMNAQRYIVRYIVRLPFASPPTTLIETRKPAKRLLITMERRGGLHASQNSIVPFCKNMRA